jgi:hypothetical protein
MAFRLAPDQRRGPSGTRGRRGRAVLTADEEGRSDATELTAAIASAVHRAPAPAPPSRRAAPTELARLGAAPPGRAGIRGGGSWPHTLSAAPSSDRDGRRWQGQGLGAKRPGLRSAGRAGCVRAAPASPWRPPRRGRLVTGRLPDVPDDRPRYRAECLRQLLFKIVIGSSLAEVASEEARPPGRRAARADWRRSGSATRGAPAGLGAGV